MLKVALWLVCLWTCEECGEKNESPNTFNSGDTIMCESCGCEYEVENIYSD